MFKQITTAAHDIVARVLYVKEQTKLQLANEEYEAMIAESQAKIGPYVPQSCPVQIWA